MMRTPFPSRWLTTVVLLALLVPHASATHDADAPALLLATDPLYRLHHDPWSGGTWVAGGGLFFHGDDGGFAHIGVREGLPVNLVHDVDPTPTALWVNTAIGPAVMAKADGSFRTIRTEQGDLFLHEGRSIFADRDSTWVGTNNQGLFKVDPVSLVASPVSNPINGSRFEHQIMDITADGSLLFISVTGYGLVEWNRSTGETRHFDLAILKEAPIYGRILVVPSKIWIATSGDGVVVVDRATGESREYSGPYTVNAMSVYGLTKLGPEYWFATDAGVSRYDTRTDSWQYWQGMPSGHTTDVVVVGGDVYATTSRGHLIQYDRARDQWVDPHWWGADRVLPHNSIFGCTMDGDDLIVSTGGGGALRYVSASHRWQPIADPDNRTAGPLDILVWDTVVLPDQMWFASHKGISILDRQSGAWGHVRTDERPVGHFVDNPVRDLYVDSNGAWAATTAHKIVRGPDKGQNQPGNVANYDAERNVWIRYTEENGLAGDSALTLDVLDNKVWVGLEQGGVDVIDAATGAIQNAWSPEDSKVQVLSIEARPDAIWVGTTQGLHRIDPATLHTTKITDLPEVVISSLLWDDGKLWVGVVLGGLYRYDVSSGQVEPFLTGGIWDASGLCTVRHGGILYVGTQWGVDRLDIERGRWLSKDGSMGLSPVQPMIQISEPEAGTDYAPGSTITLRGIAQVPKGAWVEVGVIGEWVRATGTGSWSARFPIDDSFSGPLTISARIYDGQRTMVQDAVRLTVKGSGEESVGGGVDFMHDQLLHAERGSTLPFVVEFDPREAAVTGWVELRLPSSTEAVRVPLDVTAPGVLSGVSPVLEDVGEARYVIRLEWDNGTARLPAVYGGSQAYRVTVQEPTGRPIGYLSLVRCDAGIAPGASGEVTFGVQNSGTRKGVMEVHFAGPASAWVMEIPEPFELPPSQTHFVRVPVTVPDNIPFGTHDLAIGAGPVERTAGSIHVVTCGLVVGEAEDPQSGSSSASPDNSTSGRSGQDAPHPGILLVLVALAVARMRRR